MHKSVLNLLLSLTAVTALAVSVVPAAYADEISSQLNNSSDMIAPDALTESKSGPSAPSAPQRSSPAPQRSSPAPAQHSAPAAPRQAPAPAQRSAPVAQRPAPVAQRPAPVAQRPAPVAQRPAPVAQRPAPVANKPAPVSNRPAPVSNRPAPVANKPPSEIKLKPSQGGIGGKMSGQKITGVQDVPGQKGVLRGTNEKGQQVDFKQKSDGTHAVTRVAGKTADGHQYTARYSDDGKKKSMDVKKADGTRIQTNFHKDGSTRSEVKKSDGTRIVSDSKKGGFVERQKVVGGQKVVQRTYVNRSRTTINNRVVINNRIIIRNYHVDRYGYYGYSPAYSFWGGFYTGYLFSPVIWATPFYYGYASWGNWYGNPWLFNPYNPYAYYFTPYPRYYGPSFWVTDYILADLLAIHYENEAEERRNEIARQNANLQTQIDAQSQEIAAQKAEISENEKNIMAAQVKAEMQAHEQNTSIPLVDVLAKGGYRFYLGDDVIDASYFDSKTGETVECSLDAGDIIASDAPVALVTDASGKQALPLSVDMRVVTSKRGNCPASKVISMSTDTLSNLKNDLASHVNDKLKALNDQNGKGGLPKIQNPGQVVSNVQADEQEKQQAVQALDQTEKDISTLDSEAN